MLLHRPSLLLTPASSSVYCRSCTLRAFLPAYQHQVQSARNHPTHPCRMGSGDAKRARTGNVTAAAGSDGGSSDYDFDLFTLGGGTAGVRASRLSATMGAKVALCELPYGLVSSEEVGGTGGTCVLRGCVPKKLLHYVADFSEALEDAAGSGWDILEKPKVNFAKVMELKDKELKRLSELYKSGLDNAGVTFIEGRGEITGPNSVKVNGKEYKVRNILVATGSKAQKIPIDGNEHGIISDEILALDRLPQRLAIIGSSYIACEQATIYQDLGCDVHIYNRSDMILKGFDNECRKFMAKTFEAKGVTIHLHTSPTKIEKDSAGKLTLSSKTKDGQQNSLAEVDQVLFATGRKPNTKGIGLEKAGVELDDQGGVKVDQYSRSVSTPSVFAIGDVANRIPLTPVARMEGNMLASYLFGKGDKEKYKPSFEAVAKVVFSSPALASVGMTEEEAVEQEKDVDIFTSEFTPMKSSLSKREGSKAFAKMVVNSANGKVLGVHFAGAEAAEIVQGFAVVVKHGLTKEQVDQTVGLHPTSAEELVMMTSPARQYKGGKLWLHQD